ncbi:MAG: MBL fold metallo-hydrolase [Actinobacteria bacterium 13_1_20CM_3_71_11]|nr:MAG: MBL fold metallo-hydrolase [Actinobacteria bacterium 13_1_20CM_3_71_11]
MRLVKYSHSCVRLEGDGVLVIDPGGFSEPVALDGVDAVLITHEHPDHLNLDALTEKLAGRPEVRIFTHDEVLPKLGDLASVTTTVDSGEEFTAAGFAVRAYGGRHALIHPDIPSVANLGYLVDGSVYHPGDSFDVPADATVDTLFVPVSAPWLKAAESVEFVRAVKPRRAFALHDSLLNDAGLGLSDSLMARLSGAEYRRLGAGQAVTL